MPLNSNLPSIVLANERYNLVSTKTDGDRLRLFWVWGKTDFVTEYINQQGHWQQAKVYLIKQGELFSLESFHHSGLLYDEYHFKSLISELYIELPQNFKAISEKVSAEFLKSVK